MKIREAKFSDAEDIAKVLVNSWKETYENIIPKEYLQKMSTTSWTIRYQNILDQRNTTSSIEKVFILEDEKKIVGYIAGGEVSKSNFNYDSEIHAIYIFQRYQKKGYGKQLFYKMIQYFKSIKRKSLLIWVLKENPACGFYEKLGGEALENDTITLEGKKLEMVGYVWNDINLLKI